jgi:hypothetical protein
MKTAITLATLILAGCLLHPEPEPRPGKVYKADCRHITTDGYDDPIPPTPGKDTLACKAME